MRGVNGESRVLNNTLETIHAAANAIASAENRVPQVTVQKRRRGGWWSIYWCFGSYKQKKRIGPAVLVPETSASGGNVPAAENQNPTQAPTITLPFVAPPSSPASFLPSEPPSAAQSPVGLVSLTSISASMSSIFAVGPYAHETQLVSPPVFSAFPTEPSTAPFTPPPESVHLTTPSSPEVPFARFLGPNLHYGEAGQRFPISHYEFQSYHLHPGSPVGQLISPSSGISGSGTSSPFLDDFATGLRFPEFQMGDPPKLFNLDTLSNREWASHHGSGTLTPDGTTPTMRNGFLLDHQISEIVSHPAYREGKPQHHKNISITLGSAKEFNFDNVHGCVEVETGSLSKAVAESLRNATAKQKGENATNLVEIYECRIGETYIERGEKTLANTEGRLRHHKNRSITLGSSKDFNFEYVDGCVETETAILSEAAAESLLNKAERQKEENATKMVEMFIERPEIPQADTEGRPQHHKNRSITLGSSKDFNFDNVDGCVEIETATSSEAAAESLRNEAARRKEENATKLVETYECCVGEIYIERTERLPADTEGRPHHHKNRSITLGSSKDFNFDNVDECVEIETSTLYEAAAESLRNETARQKEENATKLVETYECHVGETYIETPERPPADTEGRPQHHKNRTITLGSSKDFNFDNVDGGDTHNNPIISSDWWANEKVAGNDDGVPKNWSFFP
ncbi:Peptidase M1 family protein [Hibiscus syriacus]|uniref:Peptidase M1 family protein n=1 Tax=Hibiscus syriacus TaxID=106335 RepID=A0A6A3CWA7_HIBSY|nr:Peptidase M1 family protein [Hibiscus syriacus]